MTRELEFSRSVRGGNCSFFYVLELEIGTDETTLCYQKRCDKFANCFKKRTHVVVVRCFSP